jgi:hypothetical protein
MQGALMSGVQSSAPRPFNQITIMKSSFLKIAALLSLSLALVGVSKAVVVLDASTAQAISGFTPSWGQSEWLFYASGAEVGGTQAANYTAEVIGSGTLSDPYGYKITFDVHPTLTYALLKTGGGLKYLEWAPASVFDTFNASSDLSIVFLQNHYTNSRGNAYLGVSGIGLQGSPGEAGDDLGGDDADGGNVGLPDSTATITLLGLALLGFGLFQRKSRA